MAENEISDHGLIIAARALAGLFGLYIYNLFDTI
jgi:hypothetical protein